MKHGNPIWVIQYLTGERSMNRLDSIWRTYLNIRLQLIEEAIRAGKTDDEITAVFYSEEAKNQVDSNIKVARSYVEVNTDDQSGKTQAASIDS